MSTNIHNQIKIEYEKRQQAAFDRQASRRAEIAVRIPQIVEIESQVQKLGIKYNKAILLGGNQPQSAADELASKLSELKRSRESLLVNNGYPSDYLDVSYSCNICRDTGFVNGMETCVCYRQQLIDSLYSESNLRLSSGDSFSNFNENFFSDEIDKNKYRIDISPRENILLIKEKCMDFINNFDSNNRLNLFFSGSTGVGKTFMANCIAAEIMNKGRTVLYQTAPKLFDIINEYKMKAFKYEDFEDSGYKKIFDVDLLIIDDLGTEAPSAARFTELLNILNTRHVNNQVKPCKTIISTNIGIKQLHEYYDERVASRIIGCFEILRFAGDDLRMLKKSLARE